MKINGKIKTFYWKGKKVTEKVYKDRLRRQESLKLFWQNDKQNKNRSDNLKEEDTVVEDYRLIDINKLSSDLFCKACNRGLLLCDIKSEEKFGLASVYRVQCRNCNKLIVCSTSRKHKISESVKDSNYGTSKKPRMHFNANTRAAMCK